MIHNINTLPSPILEPIEASPPSVLSAPPNPMALLRALRRRWRIAVSVGLLCAVVAATGAWLFMPAAKVNARTLVRIPRGDPFLFKTSEPIMTLENHQRNQMAMVKSRLVLNSAIKNEMVAKLPFMNEQPDPLSWLEREVQADFAVAPEVLRISMSGEVGSELVTIVDAVRNAYIGEILDKERVERSNRLTTLQTFREKYQGELRSKKDEQQKLEALSGSKDPGLRGMMLLFMSQKLSSLERELLQTQSELRQKSIELAAYNAVEKDLPTAPVSEAQIEDNWSKEQTVRDARANIARLTSLYEGTVANAAEKERNPTAIKIRKEITDAEESLAALRKKMTPAMIEDLRQRNRFDADRAAQVLQARIGSLEANNKSLTAEVDELRNLIQARSENGVKVDAGREDMTPLEDMTRQLAREQEALKIELEATKDRYTVLEKGLAIKPRDGMRTVLAAGGAGLCAFVATLLVFSLLEFRARRVDSPDEVVFGLGLSLVGAIPASARVRPGDTGNQCLGEAVDTFRTMLLKAGEMENIRVVMITSAQSGEGKTSLSTHLAASLAQVGYSTLLIDGDLRNPIAHQLFNMDRGPGLCDLLRGEANEEQVIRPTGIARLSMISAGDWDSRATQALAQGGCRRLIEQLRTQFDYVIIDSSPVLPTVDPLLLGKLADGAIISVLRDVSRMHNVYAAYQRLAGAGVRVLGAAMNGVRGEQYDVYYPYMERLGVPAAEAAV